MELRPSGLQHIGPVPQPSGAAEHDGAAGSAAGPAVPAARWWDVSVPAAARRAGASEAGHRRFDDEAR